MNTTVKFTGTFQSQWYAQFRDLTSTSGAGVQDRISAGMQLDFSKGFNAKFGLNGLQMSMGLGYKSESTSINFAWYQEANTMSVGYHYDTRYQLQYTLRFQDSNSRTREDDK
jgi:hypothetical protein